MKAAIATLLLSSMPVSKAPLSWGGVGLLRLLDKATCFRIYLVREQVFDNLEFSSTTFLYTKKIDDEGSFLDYWSFSIHELQRKVVGESIFSTIKSTMTFCIWYDAATPKVEFRSASHSYYHYRKQVNQLGYQVRIEASKRNFFTFPRFLCVKKSSKATKDTPSTIDAFFVWR